jgi:hypothetical protein
MGKFFSKKVKPFNSHEIFSRFHENENENDFNEGEHYSHIIIRDIFKINFSSHIQNILLDSNTKVLDVG